MTISRMTWTEGVAGQAVATVTLRGPESDEEVACQLWGSTYGTPGPVFLVWGRGQIDRVNEPERFGETFCPDWVRAFCGGE